ncbi:unnamed protein product [Durusdinium trenchii]|uniref:CS domain-containing protein n=1 Tax=Durusdinium trenchii TaxID=1381693 RepID=A0ABP0JUG7_9DINO
MLADSAPKGETADYSWKQSEDEVEVTFKKEGLQKGDKKYVKVAFGRKRLRVEVKDQVIIDSSLAGNTTADECTWTLSDGVLQVTLAKADEGTWSMSQPFLNHFSSQHLRFVFRSQVNEA